MTKRDHYLILACMTLSFSGCTRSPSALVLQREWTANAEFAGDVLAARFAAQRGFTLDVREGSDVLDPIKTVRTHAAQFGVASSDRVLHENMGGANLVVLAAATYRSPVLFLARPDRAIKSPADFRGHRVGIQIGTNTEFVLKSLLSTVPLTQDAVTVVDSGWGTTNYETGAIDVLGAFAYDEPIQLELKHVPFFPIEPERYGVHFVGTVYFTTRDLARQQPELVQRFFDVLVDGWREAIAHPEEAVDALAQKFKSIDKNKELLSFKKGIPYFSGENGRLLFASQTRWQQMAQHLIALGHLKSFVFSDNVDYRFLDDALAKKTSQ